MYFLNELKDITVLLKELKNHKNRLLIFERESLMYKSSRFYRLQVYYKSIKKKELPILKNKLWLLS